MKALTWDKLRRLVGGGRQKKDKEIDSSKFQRSYSFKRGSVRKSEKRVNLDAKPSSSNGNDSSSAGQAAINPKRVPNVVPIMVTAQFTDLESPAPARQNVRPRQRMPIEMAPALPVSRSTPNRHDETPPEDDDEKTNWILRKQDEGLNNNHQIGRKERVQKFHKLLSNADLDFVGDEDDHHSQVPLGEDDFFLGPLGVSSAGTRQSTGDSALSRLTNNSSCASSSGSKNRNYQSKSSSSTCLAVSTSSQYSGGRSRSRLSMSALNLLEEAAECTLASEVVSRNESRSSNNIRPNSAITASCDSVNCVTNYYLSTPTALDSGCFHSNYNSGKSGNIRNCTSPEPSGAAAVSGSRLNLHSHKFDDEDPPRSFWWTHQKPGSTLTTSSAASKDSGLSLGGRNRNGWAWGLANKMFGRSTKPKGPVLSVSKEGYFQRTNLRRSSSKGRKSKLGVANSCSSRSSGAGRGKATGGSGRKRKPTNKSSIPQGPISTPHLLVTTIATALTTTSAVRQPEEVEFEANNNTINSSSNSIYQYYCNPMMRRDQLLFTSSSQPDLPNLVLPGRRKSKTGLSTAQVLATEANCQRSRFNGHRFETIEIRLPRLKCSSDNNGHDASYIVNHVETASYIVDDMGDDLDHHHHHDESCQRQLASCGCCCSCNCTEDCCCELCEYEIENDDDDDDKEKVDNEPSSFHHHRDKSASNARNGLLLVHDMALLKDMKPVAKNLNNRPIKVVVSKSSLLRRRHSTTLSRRRRRAANKLSAVPAPMLVGPPSSFVLPRPTVKLGDITQKGYEKKRARILAPYLPKQALAPKSNEGSASPSTRAKRRAHRRLTRNESRYHSEVRQEAVQQALAAMQSRPKPSLPMPSKRTSVMGKAPDHAQHESGDSSTDDDSIGNEEGELDDQDSSSPLEKERGDSNSRSGGGGGGSGGNRTTNETPIQQILIHSDSSSTGSTTNNTKETPLMPRPPKLPERNRVSNGTPAGPVLTYSNLGNLAGGKLSWDEKPTVVPSPAVAEQVHHRVSSKEDGANRKSSSHPTPPLLQTQSTTSAEPQQSHFSSSQSQGLVQQQRNNRSAEMTDLVEAMHNLRTHTSQSSQPPDVTSNAQSRRIAPADRLNRLNQKRSQSSSLDESSGTLTGTGRWKVSAKIQQLLNTLKRPKRRPLPEFYEDDDIELEMAAKNRDPNAPKPEGSIMSPAIGEQLVIPSGLPRNLEAAVQRYGSATFKAPVATVLDPNGKLTITLSYGKLLSRSHKIAFALLNKTSHKGEIVLKSGDRVALVYPNNDPINFICAFYGCQFAGVVPVPIEVPLTRRDAGSQQIGFLLGSCNVQVALTSEACLKGLPKTATGEVVGFKGWPKLSWFVTEHLGKTSKDFSPSPRVTDETSAYIEYATDRDGSVMGVTINRATMLAHCRSLTTACNYTEGENMVCVLDFKREVGLWHSILTSVFNGMHVIFIPYALMKVNPASWMQMITKYRASVAIVKSRDLHWGLLATRDHRDISLASIRLLLVSDGANPWSLSSCDQFLSVFQNKGLRPDAVCPCASSSEVLTVSLRRPGRAGVNATGRGVLSMQGLSHGVVRVDQENSLTSLTLQDCGQVMPGAVIVVVRMDGQALVCKTDEVGEICVHSSATGSHYWGLQGLTNNAFKVQPIQADGTVVPDSEYVRSGLLGFLGPGGLVFVCGSRNGLMSVSGRKHNADDIIATVLAVEPMKFIYRGRIAVFSIKVLRDERICVIAEQRPDCSEEESFQWMSRVLQAVDSIHQVGIYCLVLVSPNCLPKTPLGGIHLSETKRKFLEGTLHPANVLMCPHTCVTNLPKPREIHSDIGPASVMVGNIVQGNRLAAAHGRDLGVVDEESDSARKYQFISEILKWRSTSTADHVIFTLLNSKGTATMTLTCSQLHKRAERVACLLLERAKINTGDHCALVFPPGLDLIAAFYGCLYAGAVPVTVRPPHPQNLQTTLPTVRMIAEVSKSVLILSTQNVIKLLKSKEASNVVDIKSWPLTLDTDDLPKKKLPNLYRAPTAEMIAYLDFSVSTTGMLAGIKMSHAAVTSLCRSMKLACELYPSRHVALCLDPYCGLGLVLWSLSSVYSGHHSILIPPSEVEANPALWLSAVSQYKVRDTFCSYGVMELCTKGLGSSVNLLKQRNVNLACVRTCVVVAEERPRINLTNSFSKLFSALGLSPRAVSTSFGCRVNVAICLQGASSPEPSTVYVDLRALRNDRVTLVERGSPHSLCVMESGKLLPGCKVIIANPETKGQCGDSHLGEIWVQSPHNASGYFTIFGDESSYADHFNAKLVTGSIGETYARTGYLGFLRRTENVQSDGELHDAVFVVGALDETIMLRGMRYHPIDIENSILRCHKKISECAVFTWTNLLVVVVELEGNESEALDVVPLVTNCVLEDHFLVVGVVVVVDPGVVPINSRGEKQRMHLRDGFLADQLDPIFVAYNM